MNKNKTKITIKEVANEAGISITTVSHFLNHKYDSMSEETKKSIEAVIEKLNYKPNPLAQGLKGLSRTISVIVTNLSYPLCISVVRNISNIVHEKDFNLIVCETYGNKAREENILRSLVARSVDGIVIQSNGLNSDYIKEIAAKIPVIFFDREYDIPYTVNLVTNNEEASEQLTLKLFEEGYKQVLYVTESLNNLSTRIQRLEGYLKACQRFNFHPWIEIIDSKNPASFSSVISLIAARKDMGKLAIYTANGLIMLQLYPLLKDTSYRIPDDIGLATFDEPDWAEIMTPGLTCIRQPSAEFGELAANTLLKLIKKGHMAAKSKRVVLNSIIVIRGSSILKSNTSY